MPQTTKLSFGPGNRHSFRFTEGQDHIVRGVMHLRKDRGSQDIPSVSLLPHGQSLPPDVTIPMIDQAWEEQQGKWEELFVWPGPPFIAVRALFLGDTGYCILWHLLHAGDAPYDAWSLVHLTREEWEELKQAGVFPPAPAPAP